MYLLNPNILHDLSLALRVQQWRHHTCLQVVDSLVGRGVRDKYQATALQYDMFQEEGLCALEHGTRVYAPEAHCELASSDWENGGVSGGG